VPPVCAPFDPHDVKIRTFSGGRVPMNSAATTPSAREMPGICWRSFANCACGRRRPPPQPGHRQHPAGSVSPTETPLGVIPGPAHVILGCSWWRASLRKLDSNSRQKPVAWRSPAENFTIQTALRGPSSGFSIAKFGEMPRLPPDSDAIAAVFAKTRQIHQVFPYTANETIFLSPR